MRDYFLFPAQTNVEFYRQVIDCGYGQRERRRVADAYQFALENVFPLARGSGKPFISHLVGVASLVLASGCPEDWVVAALLHALYQERVPVGGGLPLDSRRPLIAQRFGMGVDVLVHRYTLAESQNPLDLQEIAAFGESDVMTLRLADELEDLCGNAIALHGGAGTDEVPLLAGTWAWRKNRKQQEANALLSLAKALGLAGIERGLTHWLNFSSVPEGMSDMRTGWTSSVDLSRRKSY